MMKTQLLDLPHELLSFTFLKNALTRIKFLPLKYGTDRRIVYGNIFKDDSDDSDGIHHI